MIHFTVVDKSHQVASMSTKDLLYSVALRVGF